MKDDPKKEKQKAYDSQRWKISVGFLIASLVIYSIIWTIKHIKSFSGTGFKAD